MPYYGWLATLPGASAERSAKPRSSVLTASEDKNEFVQAMKLGCSGIVLKQTAPELIVKRSARSTRGEIWLDSHTTAAVMRQFAAPGEMFDRSRHPAKAASGRRSSQREREIVSPGAQGYKNREMAEKMFISEQTVKNHLHNIFDKLGVSDRSGTRTLRDSQGIASRRSIVRPYIAAKFATIRLHA